MYRVVLFSVWRWSRIVVVLGTVAGFAIPLLSTRVAAGIDADSLPAERLMRAMAGWSVLYPVLAAGLGLLVATASWAPDHRGRHVHALSLPLARWRYVLLRYGAGVTLLAAPILALLAGALLAAATATIPPGFSSYPVALATRFALAALVAHGVFFAVSAGTARTAGLILGTLAGIILVQIITGLAGLDANLFGLVARIALQWPGPFAVFTGRWLLIDV